MNKVLTKIISTSVVAATFVLSGCGETASERVSEYSQTASKKNIQPHYVKVSKGLVEDIINGFEVEDADVWHEYVNIRSASLRGDNSFEIKALCTKGISSDVSTYQVYINTDENTQTGYSAGESDWAIKGADFLIDNDALFRSTSDTNWEWEWVQDIDFSTAGSKAYNYELNYILGSDAVNAMFGNNIPSEISISIEPVDSNWNDTGNYISTQDVNVDESSFSRRPNLSLIPHDVNIEVEKYEPNIFYFSDSHAATNGLNRVIEIDVDNLTFKSLYAKGDNPHSVDRAGNSDYFYVRTQNSKSFDVMNFKKGTVETVSLVDHKPRSIGASNLKYNIQLLTGKDMPVTDVIDTTTHKVITTLGQRKNYDASLITSNGGTGASGHTMWMDEDNFLMIDRVNKEIITFNVSKGTEGELVFTKVSVIKTESTAHIVEKVLKNPLNDRDYNTMYAIMEGDITKGIFPSVLELSFDPNSGKLTKTGRKIVFTVSHKTVQNVKPIAHHGGVDSQYLYVPVMSGQTYIIDRKKMKIKRTLAAELGAGHIDFSDKYGYVIVTNHFSNLLTIIDRKTLRTLKKIKIGESEHDANNKLMMQPHHGVFTDDGNYYVNFGTKDGEMFKLNLKTLEIEETLFVGGAPEQSHS